jgi:hypothetical protein
LAGEAFAVPQGGKNNNQNNKGSQNNGNKGAVVSSSAAAPAASAAGKGAAAANNATVLANNGGNNNNNGTNNNGNNGNNNNNNNNDPQSSLTLDPKVIATGFENDGQQVPTAGQVASLTSSNNFINFCLTVPNLPITNGQQIKTGSCNPAPLGIIAATTNMPAAKFVVPVNGQDFPPNQPFTIQMAINHLETGNFVNAQSNYYAAPQQVNGGGDIIGHTHFTVQTIDSFTSTKPLDSSVFAFFKGVNGAAVNGVVSETVANGLPTGNYRLCSMNTDANHTPALVAVAQHGSLDDCVYFTTGGGSGANPFSGNAANNGTANAGNNAAANNGTANAGNNNNAATNNGTASAPPAAASSAAAANAGNKANNGNKNNNKGNNNKGKKGGRRNKNGGRREGNRRQTRFERD